MKQHFLAFTFAVIATAAYACDGVSVQSPAIVKETLCVPAAPERVVTMDPYYSLLMADELDLPVIGTALSGDSLPSQFDGYGEDPYAVGQSGSPYLESILALKPYLIIGDAYSQAEIHDRLSEIAPTALVDTADWKEYLRAVALVAGKSDLADEKLAAFEQTVADTAAALPAGATVSFVRIVPGGFQVYVAGPSAYAPMSVLTEVGLKRPAFETVEDDTVLKRPTMEGLLELQGDVLIYTIGGAHHEGDAKALEAEVTSNPIWQALPAVQSGRAVRVEPTHWMGFGGLNSAYAIVDDIRRIFDVPE